MPAFSYVIKLWILILLQHNLSWPILNSKKWVKAVDTCPFVLGSVNDWYKTQEMCDKIVSGDVFMLKYFLDRYKTQGMCNKAAKCKYKCKYKYVWCFFSNIKIYPWLICYKCD